VHLPLARPATLLVVSLAFAACSSPPSASGLPEWTPTDHDRVEETSRAATKGQPGAASPAGAKGPNPVIEASWAQQCARCHGTLGHGDGPEGPMVYATDLTRPDWQATVTDDQLASSIMVGKGKMPSFVKILPPATINGLVARIRATRGR